MMNTTITKRVIRTAYPAACLERDRLIYAEIPMLSHRCEEAYRLLRESHTSRQATT